MEATDQQEELDLELIKSRSIKGVTSLISRSVLVQLISSFGFFFLTVLLGRSEIGLFFAITEIIGILGYFSDIGLAAALIQKKEKPSTKDLRTTFTIQQALVLGLISIVLLALPKLIKFYNLPQSGVYLLLALMAGFFLASLKTIPSILLERSLKFDKLAYVEVVETLIFYSIAVVLAKNGYGLSSYTFAVLGRGIAGTTLLYILGSWSVGFSFSTASLKELLKFGIPYQLNTFLAVIKDRFTNLILFKLIGAEGVGILGWAQTWSQKPLRFIMDNVTKVTFPALSRLQDDKTILKLALEKSLFFSCALIFPILFGFGILAKPLIQLIPRYSKWEVGLTPLYFYLFSAALAAVSTPLTSALNAIGKIRVTFYLMIMWTIATLTIVPIFALRLGFMGVAYATAIIALTSIVPIIITRLYIRFNLVVCFINPLASTLLMSLSLLITLKLISKPTGIPVSIIVAVIVYSLALSKISKNQLEPEFRRILQDRNLGWLFSTKSS